MAQKIDLRFRELTEFSDSLDPLRTFRASTLRGLRGRRRMTEMGRFEMVCYSESKRRDLKRVCSKRQAAVEIFCSSLIGEERSVF